MKERKIKTDKTKERGMMKDRLERMKNENRQKGQNEG